MSRLEEENLYLQVRGGEDVSAYQRWSRSISRPEEENFYLQVIGEEKIYLHTRGGNLRVQFFSATPWKFSLVAI